MARLPLVEEQDSPEVADIYARAFPELTDFTHQIKTLAHRPSIAENLVELYLGFREDSVVDRSLIELAILTVSHLNRCTYCIAHHTPLGAQSGLSEEQLTALQGDNWQSSNHFDAEQKLVMAYATHITRSPQRIPEALFAELKATFSQPQIVELTVRIALCNFFNRFNDALQLDIEPGLAP